MPLRKVADFYDEPGMRWSLRSVGPHLHPGSEESTVALALRAAEYGMVRRGRILDVASALGAPARFVARKFAATVLCVDMDRRMHAAAAATNAQEGLTRAVQPVLARTEALPFRDASCDGAWSEDAMCHMDRIPVMCEVARVLKPGAIFAFTDFIAMPSITVEDLHALQREWAFPSISSLSEYVADLAAQGFDVLLAEDRTQAVLRGRPEPMPDDDAWWREFAVRWGEAEAEGRLAAGRRWQGMIQGGRSGYGMFIGRRIA